MKNLKITLTILIAFCMSESLSAQFFSKFEHSNSLGQSQIELAGHYGQWRVASAYGGGKVANVYGLKLAFGLAGNVDARLAVQQIASSDLGSITAIGLSPKISFANHRIAIIPALSLALSDGTTQVFVNPAAIVDIIQKDKFSLNFGVNYLLPIEEPDSGELALNLGANININPDIHIRPNIQLFSPFDNNIVQYIPGIELAYRFAKNQSSVINPNAQKLNL